MMFHFGTVTYKKTLQAWARNGDYESENESIICTFM